MGAVRFSLGRTTTWEELGSVAELLFHDFWRKLSHPHHTASGFGRNGRTIGPA